ncbi:MAG: T9SS type A sorting domain-containing protein [Bacteroidales bacterium]|nr:T9SS type A sorting domain-containing protein [Bacteroidales bacterium]
MTKKQFIFLLLQIWFTVVFAQNYQSVKSDRIAYFSNQSGNVECILIDSARFTTDSVFYLFPNIQYVDYDCFTPFGASWIGGQIIVQNNGYNVFLNQNHDSIKINTWAQLNEDWEVYQFQDSSKVIARVISIDTLSFLGLNDSVKTIDFKVFDKFLNPVEHKLNNVSVQLSKNYGLVKTLNFSLFPDFEPNYFYNNELQEYQLAGLSNPKAGIQNLTWFDVHDFQPGDEIHTSYEYSYWEIPNAMLLNSEKTIFKYLERTDSDSSIVYRIDRTFSSKKNAPAGFSYNFIHDTIVSVIRSNPQFDFLPGENIFYSNSVSANKMNTGFFLTKTVASVFETFHSIHDSCWSNCCADGCFPAYEYIKGLGGPYYECTNFMAGGGEEMKLVYYKKADIEWGNPLVITAIKENPYVNKIELYPNPASNSIHINAQNIEFPITLKLLNIQGQVLSLFDINSGSSTLNIEMLKAGIYIYMFLKDDEIIQSGKLAIE